MCERVSECVDMWVCNWKNKMMCKWVYGGVRWLGKRVRGYWWVLWYDNIWEFIKKSVIMCE